MIAKSVWKPVAVLPVVLAGCFKYVPADHAELAPATPVSVELSALGMTNLAPKIGPNVVVVEGSITDASASSLTLALESVRRRGESSVANWNGESITLSSAEIGQVKRRELARGRTVAASAALAAASVGIVVGIAKATGQASGTVGGKPSPNP
ncbi:MAG TPA: hypothetical protein VFW03_24800 [Gemmatimonadaceae bacterium]|nr:hypothetical protein [Gemmatimonadaceae bacterium]